MKARRTVQQQRNAMSPQLPLATTPSTVESPQPPNGGARTPTNPQPDRKTSVRNGRLTAGVPPPIPDADGFIPLSSTRNRNSFYDNVTPSTGSTVGSIAPPKHSREPSADRVHRTANNVTYVAISDDSSGGIPPDSPTPDYEEQASDFGAALRNQYASSVQPGMYQPAGQFRQR
jgi:hypothetical protein